MDFALIVMCGIAGGAKAEKLTRHMEHRGGSITMEKAQIEVGHILHPIIGEVTQPLKEEGVLSANCEIYNWKQLAEEYNFDVRNDADLLLKILDKKGIDALEELDGVYAFCYIRDEKLYLARDKLGIKPLWYSKQPFAFASEKSALEKEGLNSKELHPRQVLVYDLEKKEVSLQKRDFFEIQEEEKELETAAEEVKENFLQAVEKRVPEKDLALLFSGGVDSTLIAATLNQLDKDFTCYSAGIQHGNVDSPRDVDWAKKVSEEMDLELNLYEASLDEVKEALPKISDWISTSSTVKLGVALPIHFALDGEEKVVMSGLGSEQLYAGYHRQQGYLNKECLSGLRSLFERDLYRDDVISMRNGYELRLPFLDHKLISHALTIPEKWKVKDNYRKYVLRMAAEKLGVPEEVAWRKKVAAQYGSNFDKAISRLAKNEGFDSKQAYLNSFREAPNNKLAALTSGGKDSNAAIYRMERRNNRISCLINIQSENSASYMFDTKEKSIVEQQAEILGKEILTIETKGEKEKELDDLERALRKAVKEYDIEGVVSGAIASTYQRDRIDRIGDNLGLKVFTPLWRENQENYMKWLVDKGFKVEITEVAARGLKKEWEGKRLDEDLVEKLIQLSREYGFNAAGEGGEFETKVIGFPQSLRPES